jgi:hypothetical protein
LKESDVVIVGQTITGEQRTQSTTTGQAPPGFGAVPGRR